MTTTATAIITDLPPMRQFTPAECQAMADAGIIAADEQTAVLTNARPFTVDEYLAMETAGILHEDDRIELMDGRIIIMAPIGNYHIGGTDWLTMLLAPPLAGRAIVRVGGPIYLNDRSAPQPDFAIVRLRPITEIGRTYPTDVYFVIEVADTSLPYDRGPKLARYAAAGIPEVWIANLRTREVTIHTNPVGSQYAHARTYRPGETVSPQAFPDIILAVNDFMPPASR